MFNFLLNLIFPKRCLSCGKFGSYLCSNCTLLTRINRVHICPICQRPSIDGATHPRCRTRYTIDGLISFWQYEGIVKKIIYRIKYDPFISDAVNEIVGKAIKDIKIITFIKFIQQKPILVPVPLHHSRLNWRGYNHAALIAKELAKRWNLKVIEDLLIRIKKTKPQVELKGKTRQENIKNAFLVNTPKYLILNTKFLIVDDVWTTGSTLKTCASILKRSGAKSVWGLTLAR